MSCIKGIDEAGRGPVLGPMVYGCLYCARSYEKTLSSLQFAADSKTLKEDKMEELFEGLKSNELIEWEVDIIDPRELSAKMLKTEKINLNEIPHESAMGLITKVLNMGVLLTENGLVCDKKRRKSEEDENNEQVKDTEGNCKRKKVDM